MLSYALRMESDKDLPTTTNTNGSPWLTAAEAATYLRVTPRSLLRWVREGHVKGHALSGTRRRTWRFLRADLDKAAMLEASTVTEVER